MCALSAACCPSLSRSGRPGRGQSWRPSGPSALNRSTASRRAWRSIPARRAASARVMPSSALATARSRRAARCPSRTLLGGAGQTEHSLDGLEVRPRQHPSASPPAITESPQPARRYRVSTSLSGYYYWRTAQSSTTYGTAGMGVPTLGLRAKPHFNPEQFACSRANFGFLLRSPPLPGRGSCPSLTVKVRAP